jgi:hypothetical protein
MPGAYNDIGQFIGAPVQGIANGLFPNPSQAGQGYYNQAYQQMPQYYQPWINQGMGATSPYTQQGQQAGNQLQGMYGQMTQNPGGLENQIGSQYQQSPGYQFQVNQALGAENRAAAAGGMAGSPQEQQNMGQITTQLANQNYLNYLMPALGMYSQGVQGLQGMYGMGGQLAGQQYGLGAQAGMGLGQNLGDILANQGNMAYAGQASQNQDVGGLLGMASGFLGGL